MVFNYKDIFPIHYDKAGKGSTIVLLHGFLESSSMWKPLIPQLSENNTVITIDLPGHGKSGVISEIHSMELMAEVVFSLLEHLQISSATFMGHSMGGYVILAFLEKYEKCAEKVVLINSTTFPDSDERIQNRNRAIKLIDKSMNTFISMAISNLFTEDSREIFSEEIENLKKEAFCFPSEGIKANIKGMRDRIDRSKILRNFQRKKYLIHAENDSIISNSEAEHVKELTGVELKIIDGGHMSITENLTKIKEFVHFIENKCT